MPNGRAGRSAPAPRRVHHIHASFTWLCPGRLAAPVRGVVSGPRQTFSGHSLKFNACCGIEQFLKSHKVRIVCGDRSRALGRLVFLAIVYTTFGLEAASAQPTQAGCTSAPGPSAAQTLRCRDGLIIVAEDGATFTLQGRNGNVNAVDLQSKALLVDAPKQPGRPFSRHHAASHRRRARDQMGGRFGQSRTSVLVLQGRVGVRRPAGARAGLPWSG